MSTRSYKFGLLSVFFILLFVLGGLLLGHRWKKSGRHIQHFGFLVGGERAHEARSNYHQQLVSRFARGTAAEQLPEDRNVADAPNLIEHLYDTIVDQTGNSETLAVLQ